MKILKLLITISSVIGLVGCSTLREAREKHNNPFELSESATFENKALSSYLQKISDQITQAYDIRRLPVSIADSLRAQAMFSYSEETIYISKAMLFEIRNEAELATLIAHEIGHYYLKHSQKQIEREENIEKSEDVVDIFESLSGINLPSTIIDVTKEAQALQFSQELEKAADEFAIQATQKVGYSPHFYADLFYRLSEKSDKSVLEELNAIYGTHRSLKNRVQDIKKYLQKNNIQQTGRSGEKEYLAIVSQIDFGISNPNKIQNEKLANFEKKLKEQKNERLSIREFLSLMNDLRALVIEVKALSQIEPVRNFMMELVIVRRPWWRPEDENIEGLQNLLSSIGKMGVGSLPVIGDSIDLYELLSGRNFYSQEELTFGERVSSALGFIAGAGEQWRASVRAISSDVPKEVKEAIEIAERAADNKDIFKNPARTVKEEQKGYRAIKNEENHKVLTELAEKTNHIDFKGWGEKVTVIKKNPQGLEYTHPDHREVKIRIMPGDSNSQFHNSRMPYVRQEIGGKSYDKNGNLVSDRSNEAHIPLEEYRRIDFWSKNGFKDKK